MASAAPDRPTLRLRWGRIAVVFALTATFMSCLAVRYTGASSSHSDATPSAPSPAAVECLALPTPVESAPGLGEPSPRTVALTFDDGPGEWTGPILDVLDKEHVVATFFVVGKAAETRKDLLATIAQRGHLLGNHTWSHPTPGPAGWDDQKLRTEMQRTEDLVAAVTGTRPCFFRPPQGVTVGLPPVTGRLGLSVALWSVDTRDWTHGPHEPDGPEQIRQLAAAGLRQEHPILLMHDGGGDRRATLAALPGVIADYRAHGYQFVRLDGQR